MKVYRCVFLAVLMAAPAICSDDLALALTIRAQTDFERAGARAFPDVPDSMRCVQSQAQVLPLMRPGNEPLIGFRKGYCELLNAAQTLNVRENEEAARDFAQAIARWGSQIGRSSCR